MKLRRRSWQGREVAARAGELALFPTGCDELKSDLEQRELLDRLREAIKETLTPHQRQVFVALALNEVPIDVLAERLDSNRGALYQSVQQ